ncbi:MAG: hypothetical protein JO189_09415, partial [Deltaproteobacteria bacterium]|nr:hypothetical protein [Deltaproteobacteria bacterium]
MALNYDNSVAALADVPASQRQRVLSGMRWSVWLSILAVPCGAAINLLLARVGPETIGVYGLLSVYIALITSFLYFGGDPVVIKFVPECNINDRPAFLASYLLVVLGFAALMVALAYFYPAAVRLVLGQRMNDRNVLLVLALAPMPILFFA